VYITHSEGNEGDVVGVRVVGRGGHEVNIDIDLIIDLIMRKCLGFIKCINVGWSERFVERRSSFYAVVLNECGLDIVDNVGDVAPVLFRFADLCKDLFPNL